MAPSILTAARADMFQGERELAIWWVGFALLFGLYFLAWWMHLRPGVFSYDSGHFLQEVLTGDITNRKPFLYARFIELTSLGGRFFPLTLFAQAAIIVAFLSRIFAMAFSGRAHPISIALGAILVLNPYVANMVFYVQNDVLFCFAIIAILAETVWVCRRGHASLISWVIIAVASPMAFAFRENGLLFLPVWCLLVAVFLGRDGRVLAGVAIVTTVVVYGIASLGVDRSRTADLMFPAVIHEVARLAQGGYRHEVGSRLSNETREVVGDERLRSAARIYWPLYWDTVGFFRDGPNLGYLPQDQRTRIVRSFLRHDLAPNLPSVAGHRVEMLAGALLARAEHVDPYTAPDNLHGPLKVWKDRQGLAYRGKGWLGQLNEVSARSRSWTWNAALGVAVLMVITLVALWRRDRVTLIAAALLWLQLGVVLAVAPSAEYRYVFMLYLAPLILLAGDPLSRFDSNTRPLARGLTTAHGQARSART
ncbi:hypothetical protein GCM10023332_01520 [Luteimonas vadosa]|uniref:Glycosyltransferase RgtA/B/C/D-like domain-containing protein n=2 Tax=Luteimonas vadosa TaxID=1165507 RepID=A0ABP9DSK5_9GAMM